MNVPATIEKRVLCPSCGEKGKQVSPATLRALLQEEYAKEIAAPQHSCCENSGNRASGCQPITGETGWRFCDSQGCDLVYFTEEGEAKFTRAQMKVAVGVKETTGERPLCYCFGHSVASIKDELRTKCRSDALEDIRQKMKDAGCYCEGSNPSGTCCLGSVAKGIETAEQELAITDSDKVPPSDSRSNRAEKIAKIGTLISAIVASSCCWLPLVLLAVGISGAGIAATLEAYRPIFIVVTFGLLAAAFYFTDRPRKTSAAAQHACCASEPTSATNACCAPTGKRWLSMMTMNKIMLWVVTTLAVTFLFFPSYVGLLLGTGDGTTVTTNMNRAVVKIEGMTCEGCVAVVENAISSVPGLLAVEVNYDKGEAVIGTEACCPVPRDEILAALQKVGYSGTIVETEK